MAWMERLKREGIRRARFMVNHVQDKELGVLNLRPQHHKGPLRHMRDLQVYRDLGALSFVQTSRCPSGPLD
ncbi:hypothetical protein L484_004170 [Morus notabilis]|uniref:Uncharacterized protein n=1 Tax=Morus notabilis TaxID=981085 RepID=W9QBY7_9ROSA|nr:hypothetical protein L484_004170 [Morus notabilis]